MIRRPRLLVHGLVLCGIMNTATAPSPAFAQRGGSDRSRAVHVQAIRKYYARVNAEAKRYAKKERDLSGFSAEGGTLIGFYSGSELRKMVATYYGESGRTITELYLADGALIFALSTDLRYVRPLGFDGKDAGKIASTAQSRFYFNKGTLIQWLDSDGKSVRTDGAAARGESQRIRTDVADLVRRLRLPPP
ncbi:MAG: hypothetical protein H7145_10305 [Akkermansiaceae bacterium]|nr:hypothetical protein [Armatimonadota bacterium]